MKSSWLNFDDKNKELIVFFNGWGFDEDVVRTLDAKDFDVIVIYDYQNLDFDFSHINFKKYEKKHLICWSMGVIVSNLFNSVFNVDLIHAENVS